MKLKLYFFISLIAFANLLLAQGDPEQYCVDNISDTLKIFDFPFVNNYVCNTDPYVLVFEDNFNGINLDRGKWKTDIGGRGYDYTPPHNNSFIWEEVYYDDIPETIEIDGELKINTIFHNPKLTKHFDESDPTLVHDFDYISAQIRSRNYFGQGIIEIYCKVPKECRMFPAFWEYGKRNGGFYNEIDCFEFPEQDLTNTNLTTHQGMNTWAEKPYSSGDCQYTSLCAMYSDASIAFHKYTIKWDDYTIQWFCDNSLQRTYYKYYSICCGPINCQEIQNLSNNIAQGYYQNLNFPSDSMQIIVNTSVLAGTAALYCIPNNSTPVFEVKYIKYYQQIPLTTCNTDISIPNESSLLTYLHPLLWPHDQVYSLVVGHNISFGGNGSNVIIPYIDVNNYPYHKYNQLQAIASNSIDLLSGFEMDANAAYNFNNNNDAFLLGSYFEAKIDPNLAIGYDPSTANPCQYGLRKENINNSFKHYNYLSNFPNPLINTTNINFSIIDSGIVTITIHDIYGMLINTIVNNKYFASGEHNIPFDASNLLSGIYFYSLETINFKDTKK